MTSNWCGRWHLNEHRSEKQRLEDIAAPLVQPEPFRHLHIEREVRDEVVLLTWLD